MFVYGAGMFSGVTVALYPLTVIKTKQMTLPGISGGLQGFRETVSTIMRSEGVPGFYRGFNTVIFGTIPARTVYLTTLEWTKSETAKGVAELGLTGPAAAGVANFAGGAVASLTTQAVTVPIDVISQKQMVHGDETVVARHQHSRAPPAASAASGSSAAAARPSPAAAPAPAAGPGPGGAATGAGGGTGRPAGFSAAAGPSGAASASVDAAAAHAGAAQGQAGAAPDAPAARGGAGASTSTSGRPAAAGPVVRRVGAMQMIRLIVKEEGVGGLYRGFGASVATFVPSSAVWWGAYGAYQKVIWSLKGAGDERQMSGRGDEGGQGEGAAPGGAGAGHDTSEVLVVQTMSSVLAGCTSSLVTTPLDLIKTRIQVSYKHDGATPTIGDVARQILREDGPTGFLRGALPRMINASLWGTCMVTVYESLKRMCAE
ncbi:hypothetical protein GPECTOR_69g422 [Gonium pectorale]|uniref:MC family transporter n=1 Tax=Gonium pectorale TaxID=33097 RepID=A0A150G376_GONPE|nr:hypothetical protein GPECTOR_69g422 [Gonium pectorale]|eukprot:KXZ44329.1 hypothetical protein GPECTOR_69g422 [Gonium pectorale]